MYTSYLSQLKQLLIMGTGRRRCEKRGHKIVAQDEKWAWSSVTFLKFHKCLWDKRDLSSTATQHQEMTGTLSCMNCPSGSYLNSLSSITHNYFKLVNFQKFCYCFFGREWHCCQSGCTLLRCEENGQTDYCQL